MSSSKASGLNILAAYNDYVISNASTVTSVESTLRTLTYLIPGRFQDADLASEALSASLNLLGIYHDSILARAVEKLEKKPTLSPHNRYTKFWTSSSAVYKNLSIFVTTIQHCSFLLEIVARKRFGEKGRWRMILSIEAIKAICRIVLLQETKSRQLVFPHVPEREIDPAALEESLDAAHLSAQLKQGDSQRLLMNGSTQTSSHPTSSSSSASPPPPSLDSSSTTTSSPPTTKPDFATQEAVTDYLLRKVLNPEHLKSPSALLHKLKGPAKAAELLYILRPLIYASLLSRTRSSNDGARNWQPWLVGIAVEYAARELYKTTFQRTHVGGLRALTSLERAELQSRGRMMWWWILRGAFYEKVTKPRIQGIVEGVEARVPVIGTLVGSVVRDYEYWWNSYFTTASI